MKASTGIPAIAFWAILASHALAPAQQERVSIDHLTTAEGLAHTITYDILQDRTGFLWIGGITGVDRYDGYRLKHFSSIPFQENSLSHPVVLALLEDHQGYIWVGTAVGLNRLDPRTQHIRHFFPPHFGVLKVSCLVEDRAGNLWIGTLGQGLFSLDSERRVFQRYLHHPGDERSLSNDIIRALHVDREGNLWVGTAHGLNRVVTVPDSGQANTAIRFIHFWHDPEDPASLSSNLIESVFVDSRGILWVGTATGGLNRLIGWTERNPAEPGVARRPIFKHYLPEPGNPFSINDIYVTTVFEDRRGDLWIGTGNGGVNLLDLKEEKFYHYQARASDPTSLNNNFVHKFCEDRTGNLWIATHGGGINKLIRSSKQIRHIVRKSELPPGMESNNVTGVLRDRQGNLWVNLTHYGITRYDPERRRVEQIGRFFSEENLPFRVPTPAMAMDSRGLLWFGTWGSGLYRFNPLTRQLRHYPPQPDNPDGLADGRIIIVCPRRDGRLWIATQSGGLHEFNPSTERFKRYLHDPHDPGSISSNSTHALYEDRQGRLWIGTLDAGLNLLVEDTTVLSSSGTPVHRRWFKHFRHDPEDTTTLASPVVIGIFQDSRGTFWLSTAAGLERLDARTGQVRHFNRRNGYPFDYVYWVQEDRAGNLWVATPRALVKFNENGWKETGRTFQLFQWGNGLADNLPQPLASSAWLSPEGELFIGGVNGIVAFYPENLRLNRHVPPVVFTDFSVGNQPVQLDSSISFKKTVRLSYRQSDFTIAFAALDFTRPVFNRYAYMLEGYDRHWIEAGNHPRATYTRVPPGRYVFRVRGSNNDGVWNEAGVSLEIVIPPPFWQAWWFRVLAAAIVVALLALAYRYRVNRLLELERTRQRIARDLHDDVGSSLSSIALTAELLQKELATNGLVSRQLRRVRTTAQKLIGTLEEIVWAVDPSRDYLEDCLAHMRELASALLTPKGIAYAFHVQENGLPDHLPMAFRKQLFLIYKELLHNVVKHAAATRVHIRCLRENHYLVLEVCDNGRGFRLSNRPHSGHGLESIRQRAADLEGRVEICSQPGSGTQIRVYARLH